MNRPNPTHPLVRDVQRPNKGRSIPISRVSQLSAGKSTTCIEPLFTLQTRGRKLSYTEQNGYSLWKIASEQLHSMLGIHLATIGRLRVKLGQLNIISNYLIPMAAL